MAEKSADEKLAQTLKTLLSSSNRFKLEPPTVMASSPSFNMHINVNAMLNLVYDLITRGKHGDEKPGVRYEERSSQTPKGGCSMPRTIRGSQSLVSVGVQANDLSELERLRKENQVLTRSFIDLHAQYTRHKGTCTSCPPPMFSQELKDIYLQASNTSSTIVHAAAGVYAASKSPTSEVTGGEAVSSTSNAASKISMDVDPLPQPADSCSSDTTSGPSTSLTARSASVPTSDINGSTSTAMDIDDGPPPRPAAPGSSDRGSAPPSLFSGSGGSRSESPATEVTAAPDEPIDLTMSPSRSPSIEISDEGQAHVAAEPRARVVVQHLWWKDEMNETMFKRFMTTRLLECRMCEPDGYRSFQDDEEDVKEQIQVHFEEKHPEISCLLKKCNRRNLKALLVFNP